MEVLIISKSFIIREALSLFFSNRFKDYKVRCIKDLKEAEDYNLININFVFVDIEQSKDSISDIKEVFGNSKIMVFNKDKNKEIFIECFKNGINSYIVDIPEKDELMHILNTVIKGKKYYDVDLLEEMINERTGNNFEDSNVLTDRENQVLDKVSIGLTNKEIAKELYVSEHTIKKHVTNILSKLDMRNRRDLIIYKRYNSKKETLSIM
ncbi:bacterial regulatory s, luxR family protein [[Clostridium] bifermentans ATCC 638]|uniref:Stage 0 sporulation protein A homolog n=1 Tax=Paraclostridium bifermentans ATCC 638 = DSM 14991 TaxID=1233171 RepID=T4VG30_PARBF|nr:response regulator transcription factor [Paraclostridium bifermentans]EQK40483.1 bacterial regulatory s, luxR family protein [[Clostridium] bifermentans ATCC 638] [Paraclostridium bifermentans ATCC 638 = DSM 14991]RIZ58667.1 helix-turn-helix transcriptional regulator [Paraclostridium bifermentans]UAG18110.1 response regulator transcription factor [Paraclostridium bifermentans]